MPVGPSVSPSASPSAPLAATPAAPGADRQDAAPRTVTAVLVAHDGERWLPDVLAALAAQTVRPTQVVAVDTGSSDGSADLLRAALGADAVLALPATTTWPDAVAAGVAQVVEPTAWLWLLHDDAAPDPDCLERLLDAAADRRSAALLGPKAVDWDAPQVLVEVGVTTDRSGARVPGVEPGEPDLGQHDAVTDVLAVGTAGALVRRDVWDAVGGLDPALPLFRDDVDLGWRITDAGSRVLVVPAARVRHARAATTGRRPVPSAHRQDRRSALFVLLAHASSRRLLVAVPALVLATLVRALGLLLLRRPHDAADEVAALAGLVRQLPQLRAARARREALRTAPASAAASLLSSRRTRLRAHLDARASRRAGGPGLRELLRRRPVLLVLALALVALVAERALLAVHGGVLSGGRLLPPHGGASDLWSVWTSSWSSTGEGTGAPVPPLVGVLAALATLLLGKAQLALDVVLLASVPLAGITAYLAARRAVRSELLRLAAAATWALLPVATGAVAGGRLDAAALQVLLPLVALSIAKLLRDDPSTGWHRSWAAGLLLTLACAMAPSLLLVELPLLLVAAAAGPALAAAPQRLVAQLRSASLVLVAMLPVLLLLPYSAWALQRPALLAAGPGRLAADPALTDPALPAWHLPLLAPGGAGLPPTLTTLGLLLAALAGLVRLARRRVATVAWCVALGALLVAALFARTTAGVARVPVWPGVPLQVVAVGLLLAALVAADGVRERLSRIDFGWRQLTAALVAALAALTPVVAAVTWMARGADGPLARAPLPQLPAFVSAELAGEPGVRVLALQPRSDGSVGYELTTSQGGRIGVGDRPVPDASTRRLDGVVRDLVSGRGAAAAPALATRAVRYVVLPRSAAGGAIATAVDTTEGLSRRSDDPVLLWEVTAPTAHLTVLDGATADAARRAAAGPTPDLPAPVPLSGELRTQVPPGGDGRLVALAEARDAGWQATLDGRRLPATTAWGWAQAFRVPPGGGRLVVQHAPGLRAREVALQLGALVLVGVLAVPAGRRREGLVVVPRSGGAR